MEEQIEDWSKAITLKIEESLYLVKMQTFTFFSFLTTNLRITYKKDNQLDSYTERWLNFFSWCIRSVSYRLKGYSFYIWYRYDSINRYLTTSVPRLYFFEQEISFSIMISHNSSCRSKECHHMHHSFYVWTIGNITPSISVFGGDYDSNICTLIYTLL